MKSLQGVVLLLLLLPGLASAQKKDRKNTLPAVFEHARFVFVEAVDGEEFNPNLDTPDRLAIADVRDALHAWGRYTLTPEREKADLIFVVRKGQLADRRGGIGPGGEQDPQGGQMGAPFPGRQRQPGPDLGVGGEAGPPEDLLKVCQLNANGKLSSPVWIHSFAGGLDAPRFLLFAQFKEAVEKAYPAAPASPPAKP